MRFLAPPVVVLTFLPIITYANSKLYRDLGKCRDDSNMDSSRSYLVNRDITAYCTVSLEFLPIIEICGIKSFNVQKIKCLD